MDPNHIIYFFLLLYLSSSPCFSSPLLWFYIPPTAFFFYEKNVLWSLGSTVSNSFPQPIISKYIAPWIMSIISQSFLFRKPYAIHHPIVFPPCHLPSYSIYSPIALHYDIHANHDITSAHNKNKKPNICNSHYVTLTGSWMCVMKDSNGNITHFLKTLYILGKHHTSCPCIECQ